jgi:3-dehydroquinate dehydratase II
MKKILILNGPNINLLHLRDKSQYGHSSLENIEKDCLELALQIGIDLQLRQTNSEGGMVEEIQDAINKFDAIIVNAAGYTHTSVAIRDALEIFKGIKIELHISNIHKREEFRQQSLISGVVDGIICGIGTQGYPIALLAVDKLLKNRT